PGECCRCGRRFSCALLVPRRVRSSEEGAMRMPWYRKMVWKPLAIVILCGYGLAVALNVSRVSMYHRLAEDCAYQEARGREWLAEVQRKHDQKKRLVAELRSQDHPVPSYDETFERAFNAEAQPARDEINRAAQMRRKYERAARYPWLFVAPDPPPRE